MYLFYIFKYLQNDASCHNYKITRLLYFNKANYLIICLQVKEEISFKSNTVAIMAQCCGRQGGSNTQQQFREIFPNIPLIGVDVNGEFGLNSKTVIFSK